MRRLPVFGLALVLMAAFIYLGLATPELATRLPKWDEASHGFAGVAFYDAWRDLSLPKFLREMQLSAYWPPAYPLLESLVFLLLGPKLVVARTLSLVLAAANLGLLYAVATASGVVLPLLAGTVAAALLYLSPGYEHYGLLCMLEIPGIFVNLLALIAMLRYLQAPSDKLWRWVCLLSSVLFFTKYNYAIMWMGAVVLWQLGSQRQHFRAWIKAALALPGQLQLRHPVTIVCGLYAVFLALIAASGGGDYHVFGQVVELHSILGNPLYILVVLFVLGHLLFNRQRSQAAWRALWRLPEPWGTLVRWTFTPIAVWFLSPQNFATFLKSVINDSKRESYAQIFTYYPRALMGEHSFVPWFGVAVLLALGLALVAWRRLPPALRFVTFFTSLSFVAVCLHPNLITRYLVTVLPFLFLTAGLLLAWLVGLMLANKGSLAGGLDLAAGVALVALVVAQAAPVREQMSAAFAGDTMAPEYRELVATLCADVGEAHRSTVVGYGDVVSPAVLAWQCYEGGMPAARLPQALNIFGLNPSRHSVEEIVASGEVERFFLLEFHNPALLHEEFIQDFASYQRFPAVLAAAQAYQAVAVHDFPALKVTVRTYAKVAKAASASAFKTKVLQVSAK